jgi:hypothetical protein
VSDELFKPMFHRIPGAILIERRKRQPISLASPGAQPSSLRFRNHAFGESE